MAQHAISAADPDAGLSAEGGAVILDLLSCADEDDTIDDDVPPELAAAIAECFEG